eukprot:g45837.t1
MVTKTATKRNPRLGQTSHATTKMLLKPQRNPDHWNPGPGTTLIFSRCRSRLVKGLARAQPRGTAGSILVFVCFAFLFTGFAFTGFAFAGFAFFKPLDCTGFFTCFFTGLFTLAFLDLAKGLATFLGLAAFLAFSASLYWLLTCFWMACLDSPVRLLDPVMTAMIISEYLGWLGADLIENNNSWQQMGEAEMANSSRICVSSAAKTDQPGPLPALPEPGILSPGLPDPRSRFPADQRWEEVASSTGLGRKAGRVAGGG